MDEASEEDLANYIKEVAKGVGQSYYKKINKKGSETAKFSQEKKNSMVAFEVRKAAIALSVLMYKCDSDSCDITIPDMKAQLKPSTVKGLSTGLMYSSYKSDGTKTDVDALAAPSPPSPSPSKPIVTGKPSTLKIGDDCTTKDGSGGDPNYTDPCPKGSKCHPSAPGSGLGFCKA